MAAGSPRTCTVDLPGGAAIEGDLAVPDPAVGLVVFAHGSGSSRHSPRNRSVAAHLGDRGLATLLVDLLTPDEEVRDRLTAEHRFDIALLAERVVLAVDWLQRVPEVSDLPVGCFGASTGAAAALVAAAERPGRVGAVVSRGGRPDLAGEALARVAAPTLLLVGSEDHVVLELNAGAADRLPDVELQVVPGAGHLFEEPGAMERVQEAAAAWFLRWLAGGGRPAPT